MWNLKYKLLEKLVTKFCQTYELWFCKSLYDWIKTETWGNLLDFCFKFIYNEMAGQNLTYYLRGRQLSLLHALWVKKFVSILFVIYASFSFRSIFRFQYVLSAPTSPATKVNEETLTYLNQGQTYELKVKRIGGNQNNQHDQKYYKVGSVGSY